MSGYWPDPDQSNGSLDHPGIYRFTIEGSGIYIGRFTRRYRVVGEYPNNVRRIFEQGAYRKSDGSGFRFVHVELHRALVDGRTIRPEVVENYDISDLNVRERYWIEQVPIELRLNGKK